MYRLVNAQLGILVCSLKHIYGWHLQFPDGHGVENRWVCGLVNPFGILKIKITSSLMTFELKQGFTFQSLSIRQVVLTWSKTDSCWLHSFYLSYITTKRRDYASTQYSSCERMNAAYTLFNVVCKRRQIGRGVLRAFKTCTWRKQASSWPSLLLHRSVVKSWVSSPMDLRQRNRNTSWVWVIIVAGSLVQNMGADS